MSAETLLNRMDILELLGYADKLGIAGVDDFETHDEIIASILVHLRSTTDFVAPSTPQHVEVPAVRNFYNMDLLQLDAYAQQLGIPHCDDFRAAEEYFEAILFQIEQEEEPEGQRSRKPTLFPKFATFLKTFLEKRQQTEFLIRDVCQRLDRVDVDTWGEKIGIRQQPGWMTREDFDKASKAVPKNLVFLVVGSTSSGKSTLLNAILGAPILPTSHNAATSVFCEITRSSDGSSYALLHFKGTQSEETKRLDLTSKDGQNKFREFVSPSRYDEPSGLTEQRCLKADIYWPLDFLEGITLMDSPGVTEDEDPKAAAQQIVEQSQGGRIGGFIFVLNGTLVPEEAAQMGGLVHAIASSNQQMPSLPAIFVLNKWDIVCQEYSYQETQSRLTRTRNAIRARWPGLKDWQLVTMNARQAATTQQMGKTTKDLHILCDTITRLLPIVMDCVLLNAIWPVYSLTNKIERKLQEGLYSLTLPAEERIKKWSDEWEKLDGLRRSLQDGRLATICSNISEEIQELVRGPLPLYLKSKDAKNMAMSRNKEELNKKEQKMFDEKRFKDLAYECFVKVIAQSTDVAEFTRWADGEILDNVRSFAEEFGLSEIDVNGTKSDDSGDSTVKQGGRTLAELTSFMRGKKIRTVMEQEFKQLVNTSCDDDCSLLFEIVKGIAINKVKAAQLVFQTFPQFLDDLNQRLQSRASNETADIPVFERALTEVGHVNGPLAKFILEMKIHQFEAKDITFLDEETPQSRGFQSHRSVCNVLLPGKKHARLTLLDDTITELNAGDLLNFLRVSRKFDKLENVISFYGSVIYFHQPLQIAVLFEDGGSLTLADLMFSVDWQLPNTQCTFDKAKEVVVPMLDGLDFLHKNAMVHGNLAPETIVLKKLLKGYTVKLSLPSTSHPKVDKLTAMTSYLAPETFNKQRPRQASDIYSIGVVLWEMLHGRRAYLHADLERLGMSLFVRQVKEGNLVPGMSLATEPLPAETVMGTVPAIWDDLSRNCLRHVDWKRPKIGDVREAFCSMTEKAARMGSTAFDDIVTVSSYPQQNYNQSVQTTVDADSTVPIHGTLTAANMKQNDQTRVRSSSATAQVAFTVEGNDQTRVRSSSAMAQLIFAVKENDQTRVLPSSFIAQNLPQRSEQTTLSDTEHVETAAAEEDVVVIKLLEAQVRHWRNECKRQEMMTAAIKQKLDNVLDAAVEEKIALQNDVEQMKLHVTALEQALSEQGRRRACAVADKTMIERKIAILQCELGEERTKKEVAQQQLTDCKNEKEDLKESLRQTEALLTNAEQTIAEQANAKQAIVQQSIRCRKLSARADDTLGDAPAGESEKVLKIPSRDIQLTDKQLGRGSYGVVSVAYWRGCPVALKMLYEVLATSQRNLSLLLQEVSIAWKVHHPNVASVCGVTLEIEDEKKTAWIILELLQGSMANVIAAARRPGVRQLSLREKVDMTKDSLCGLDHLHTLPRLVLHGDIRPTNILVTPVMRAKLGDLGAARFDDASLSIGLVSPAYTAPERLADPSAPKTKETDIYSMGVTMCELFTGLEPSVERRHDQLHVLNQRSVRFLCMQMVSRDPQARPSAATVLAGIDRVMQTGAYKDCPPRRMVKGKLDGVANVTLTEQSQ